MTTQPTTIDQTFMRRGLAVVFWDLAAHFRGDLFSLVMMDAMAAHYEIPLNLSTIWAKYLKSGNRIWQFIIMCGKGMQSKDLVILATSPNLKQAAALALSRDPHRNSRASLLSILHDMYQIISASEHPAEQPQPHREHLLALIKVTGHIVESGPPTGFRLDLCRRPAEASISRLSIAF